MAMSIPHREGVRKSPVDNFSLPHPASTRLSLCTQSHESPALRGRSGNPPHRLQQGVLGGRGGAVGVASPPPSAREGSSGGRARTRSVGYVGFVFFMIETLKIPKKIMHLHQTQRTVDASSSTSFLDGQELESCPPPSVVQQGRLCLTLARLVSPPHDPRPARALGSSRRSISTTPSTTLLLPDPLSSSSPTVHLLS